MTAKSPRPASLPAYGGLVVVAHAAGYETWYAHLSAVGVEVGDRMRRGQQVGRIGSTGYEHRLRTCTLRCVARARWWTHCSG